jgi:hypothetical protein
MTRINSGIEPSELCDQHLVAEYREIGRIGTLLNKRIGKSDVLKGKPNEFTLGKGHMLFFIDKGEYIRKRFERLVTEMHLRGFNTTLEWRDQWRSEPSLNNDWSPDDRVRKIVSERIKDRMPKNPRKRTLIKN